MVPRETFMLSRVSDRRVQTSRSKGAPPALAPSHPLADRNRQTAINMATLAATYAYRRPFA